MLIAERGQETAGMLAVQRCHNLAQGTTFLLLSDLYVAPDHRKHHVAAALTCAAKALAERVGCSALRLMVPDFNVAALTAAARAGFTRPDELLLSLDEEPVSTRALGRD